MPEIVKVKIGLIDCCTNLVPGALESSTPQRSAEGADEHTSVLAGFGELVEMGAKLRNDLRGYRHHPSPGT